MTLRAADGTDFSEARILEPALSLRKVGFG